MERFRIKRKPAMSRPDKVWAYCPKCKHTQRFVRIQTLHLRHAIASVLTCGLWAISWAALVVGRHYWPWRCKHCDYNDPDFSKVRKNRSSESKSEIEA